MIATRKCTQNVAPIYYFVCRQVRARFLPLLPHSRQIASICSGHLFHRECLAVWFARSRQCPTCRERMGSAAEATLAQHLVVPDAGGGRWRGDEGVDQPVYDVGANRVDDPWDADADLRRQNPAEDVEDLRYRWLREHRGQHDGAEPSSRSEWCGSEAFKFYFIACLCCFCGPIILRSFLFSAG